MEKRQERRRKFHESLLNMLYAHSPQEEDEDPVLDQSDRPDIPRLGNQIPDELVEEKSSSSSPSEHGDLGDSQKLTRAQRKRLRKKMLKQAASHRRKIIGPELELPTTNPPPPPNNNNNSIDVGDGLSEHQCQSVRQNDQEVIESENDHLSRDPSSCISQNKQKRRRASKKLAMEKLEPPATGNIHQGPTLSNSNHEA